MARAYYNENDAEAAAWLQKNIDLGLIAPGFVDTRSVVEVHPDDLLGFTQHHFFAGIGGWSYAARLARWPDGRPLWTASCPCQPFSAAGKGLGTDDPRHLWPHLFRLWRAFRPVAGVGEQVAGAPGYNWFDGVRADLAREGFASRVVDIPALAVDAPHQRNRLYWVALADGEGIERRSGLCEDEPLLDWSVASDDHGRGALVDAASIRRCEGQSEPVLLRGRATATRADGEGRDVANSARFGSQVPTAGRQPAIEGSYGDHHPYRPNGSWWNGADWLVCHDGKARRVADASAPLLVDGVPNRVLAWRGFGNAIVPPLAAEVIGALMDVLDAPSTSS